MKLKITKENVVSFDNISLGISIVVAVLLGVGVGLLLKSWTGETWTLWVGVFWGVGAAILNIYKAYKRAKKDFDSLLEEPKYKYMAEHGYKKDDE